MKFIRRILFFILVIIIILGTVFYLSGKKLYDSKISEISIEDKISSIKASENFTPLSEVPDYYKNAVVSVEDRRYYSHGAVDFIALIRATIKNISQKEFREGGSSITQQTAKNLYFIDESNVIARKAAEVLLSYELEKKYSKNDILEIYINTIYFGNGYYGIKEACNGYLNKEPSEMNISEATMLAGVPNAPSLYNPKANIDLTISRQKKVISSMVENNYLTTEEANNIELYNNN